MRCVWVSSLILVTLTLINAENRDDWLDPNDMLNFDPSTNTMKKNKVQIPDLKTITTTPSPQQAPVQHACPPCQHEHLDYPKCDDCNDANRACPKQAICPKCNCEPQKECICEQAALPLLRQYIKSILTHIGEKHPGSGTDEFIFHVSLSPDRFKMLEKFVREGNQKHVHDVHEILATMIHQVSTSELGRLEKTAQWLEHKIGLKLDRLIQFFMLGALASIVLVIEIKLQIAWRRRVSQLIILMFIISIPWTWFELYKQAEIKQQSVATRKMPKECEGGERDVWSSLKSYFTLQDDKCHEYYEHLMIDPMIKVPPTKAIAVTFVRFFVAPLKDVGGAMSEFIRALLIDLPVTLYPVAIAMVVLFLFMVLFMWFGYSIRLPFFLTIERSAQLSVGDSQLHKAIQENNQQTKAQLEKLQAKIEDREVELAEKLEQFEKKQHLALEYMSSETSSLAASPTISRSDVNKESLNISQSPVKKMSETKVKSSSNIQDVTRNMIGASGETCDMTSGERSAISDVKKSNNSDKNENPKVKDKCSDDENCMVPDITNLGPDESRE